MKSVFETIAPAMEALTSICWPATSAVTAITSSVRFPSVALSKPPTASPVLAATDSVAWLRRAASGTIARTESTNSTVPDAPACSAVMTIGTNTRSHSRRLPAISFHSRRTRPPAVARLLKRQAERDDHVAAGRLRIEAIQADGGRSYRRLGE